MSSPQPCTHRYHRILSPAQYIVYLFLASCAQYYVYTLSTATSSIDSDTKSKLHALSSLSTFLGFLAILDSGLAEKRARLSVLLKVVATGGALAGWCTLYCLYGKDGIGCDFGGFVATPAQPAEVCDGARNALYAFGVMAFVWLTQLFHYLRVLRAEKRHNLAQATTLAIPTVIVESDAEKGVSPLILSQPTPFVPTPFCVRCAHESRMIRKLQKHASSSCRIGFHTVMRPLFAALYALACGYAVYLLHQTGGPAIGEEVQNKDRAIAMTSVYIQLWASLHEAIVGFRARKTYFEREKVPGRWLKAVRMVAQTAAGVGLWMVWGGQCTSKALWTATADKTCESAGSAIFFFLLAPVIEVSVWRKQAWIRRKVRVLRQSEEGAGAIALPVAQDEPLVVNIVKE